jgi:hypothetical protein
MKRTALFLAALIVMPITADAQGLIKKDSADVSRRFMLRDSADFTPETGATITGLDLQYTRNFGDPSTKADATALSATDDAHADNQCIEIDATSSPGLYRCDWPDAAFATGASSVTLCVTGTGFDPSCEDIQLIDFDPEDGVRLALTALPNAAADAAGGLPISDAGGVDLDAQATSVAAVEASIGTTIDLGSGATLSDNNADIAGATFSSATDSNEAIRNRGDAAWTTGAGGLTPLASGTAQAGGATTIQLAAAETFADSILVGTIVKVTSGTGAGQARVVTGYVGSTDTATVTPAWTANPSSDSVYEVVEGYSFVAALAADSITAAVVAEDALGTSELHADVIVDASEMRAAVGLAAANLDTQLGAIDDAVDTEVAAIVAAIGTPSELGSGATLADNLVDIEAQTNDIGTAGAGLTESGGTGDQFTAIDIASIAGNAAAAIGLSYSGRAIVAGTAFCDADPCVAVAGTLSATQMSTNLTETTDTHFVDRIIIWITGDLAGAVGTIEAYNGTTKVLTYTSQGEAPSAGDVFVIL